MKTDPHWKPIGLKPHHGIAVPLSAIRSKQSSGIGEFSDLLPLIDFCKKIHFDTIQLLPINDTGNDTSPYNIISSCALDPVYLTLEKLSPHNLKELKALNHTPRVQIYEVKQKKLSWLYQYFQEAFSLKNPDYQKFVQKHQGWLVPYAQFKGGNPEFHSFLQFLCFSQMEEVRAYASKQGCFLKGDIPILLNAKSVDVWQHPKLFQQDLVAGAPPDFYNSQGQKWEFPIFNWDAMRKEHFAWWTQRLSIAGLLFHLYRIDHVVGFFRIWAIPKDKTALEGFFVPHDPHLWEGQGRELLEMMIKTSPLLPIAEDLGTIPKEVPPTLKSLGICSTKVIRWQRRWHDGREYIPLSEYEPLSMTTISTHDSETLQMWWEQYPEEAKLFAELKHWSYHPILTQEQRFTLLYDAHHTPSYFHINLLQEYLALFPDLVSKNPEDERINVPGTVLLTNWTYRFKPSIEELLAHQPLIQHMQKLTNI